MTRCATKAAAPPAGRELPPLPVPATLLARPRRGKRHSSAGYRPRVPASQVPLDWSCRRAGPGARSYPQECASLKCRVWKPVSGIRLAWGDSIRVASWRGCEEGRGGDGLAKGCGPGRLCRHETRWTRGEVEIEQLISRRELERVTGAAADVTPLLTPATRPPPAAGSRCR